MLENELTPLDALLLAAELSGELKIDDLNAKSKPITGQNEDEFFLSKIATNDLRALQKNTKPIKETSVKSVKNTSLIHNGDTDSSDDEINRNHENSKYNECGNELRHLLPEIKDKSEISGQVSLTWRQNAAKSVGQTQDNVITDPFFGIRISKPLISSTVLAERMTNRTAVPMSRVQNFVKSIGQASDWVIAGCIVQKSPVKTSQNGAKYLIWTLSDLQNDLQTVSMFLFKSAYRELWKSAIGTVVGILNPSILENREGSRQQATLSVDNHQKVMVFGQSKDFGICKSKKKDGEACTSFVNVNRCSFCLYHVRQEYQKCSQRSELQSKLAGQGLTALRNKVLGKNEVFYAGKSYMAIPAKKNQKLLTKDNKRMNDLTKMGFVTSAPAPVPKKTMKQGAAASLDSSRSQRLKDLEMIQRLNGTKKPINNENTATKSINNENTRNKINLPVPAKESAESEKAKRTALYLKKYNDKLSDDSENINDPNMENTETVLESSRRTAFDVIAKLKIRNGLKATTKLDNSENSPKHCAKFTKTSKDCNKSATEDDIILKDIPVLNKIEDNESASKTKLVKTVKECIDSITDTASGLKVTPNKCNNQSCSSESQSNIIKSTEECVKFTSKDSTLSPKTNINEDFPNKNLIEVQTYNSKPIKTKQNLTKSKDITNLNTIKNNIIENVPKSIASSKTNQKEVDYFKDLISSPAPTLFKPQNNLIDLSSTLKSPRTNSAKLKALQYVIKNGPISNDTKKTGVKRFLENSEDPKTPKRPKTEKVVFTDRFQKIMAMTSKHADLLEQQDLEVQDKYFQKLESREQMEEKMMSTYKIECKAVKCLNCKYTSFSAADRCKKEKHHLKVFNATKRFFKCGNCGNRTCALEILPLFSCKNCQCKQWVRTTMMAEKKVHVGEVLSIRGGEQKFMASVQTGANINLLVPDD